MIQVDLLEIKHTTFDKVEAYTGVVSSTEKSSEEASVISSESEQYDTENEGREAETPKRDSNRGNNNGKVSSKEQIPSTPNSCRVTRSGCSEATNDTSPSSVETSDNRTISARNSTLSYSTINNKNGTILAKNIVDININRSTSQINLIDGQSIGPLDKPSETVQVEPKPNLLETAEKVAPIQSGYAPRTSVEDIIYKKWHHIPLGERRHTSPHAITLRSRKPFADAAETTSVDIGPTDVDPTDVTSLQLSRRQFGPRNSFPVYNVSSSNDIFNAKRNSTSTEILRMKGSILSKRKKKKRNFLEEDRVLVGNKISEGHENFVLAYNMLSGIRVAVSRCSGVMKKLIDRDFEDTKKLSFSMDGTELTPSSKYDFKFKDYSPAVFRELRHLFGLDPADYLVSITGKYILSELNSPGKSGSFFYYSRDYRFIIKTIHHSEHKQLRKILKDYYNHVKENPNTLISQFYGLHRVKMPFGNGGHRKIHFIVMNNLFPPHRDIHLKYDLKGSTWGRVTKYNTEQDLVNTTLKDLNWLERNDKIKFGPHKRKLFFEQLEKDVKLLKQINVMDYSLLLGIHDVKKGNNTDISQKLSVFDPKSTDKYDLINTNPRYIDRENDLPTNVFPGRSKYVFYGHDGGIRATDENNEPLSEIYYLGVIDCLTNYSLKKKLETFWRSLGHSRKTISAIPASEYGERFFKFIKDGTTQAKSKVI